MHWLTIKSIQSSPQFTISLKVSIKQILLKQFISKLINIWSLSSIIKAITTKRFETSDLRWPMCGPVLTLTRCHQCHWCQHAHCQRSVITGPDIRHCNCGHIVDLVIYWYKINLSNVVHLYVLHVCLSTTVNTDNVAFVQQQPPVNLQMFFTSLIKTTSSFSNVNIKHCPFFSCNRNRKYTHKLRWWHKGIVIFDCF